MSYWGIQNLVSDTALWEEWKKIKNICYIDQKQELHPFPLLMQPYADVSLTVVVVVDRLLREHAMIVEVQVYARNAMVKDLCSRECPMKALTEQGWWQKTRQLDTQQGRLSYRSFYSSSPSYCSHLRSLLTGFRRSGATAWSAHRLDPVPCAVAVAS